MAKYKKSRKKCYKKTNSKFSKGISKFKNELFNSSMKNGFDMLKKCSIWRIFLLLVANFFVGTAILSYTHTMEKFLIHLICLTINIILTIKIGREYVDTLAFCQKEIVENKSEDNNELRILYKNFYIKALHKRNLLFCFIILLIFFWGIFSQNYITFDLVGCYAVFMVFITVSISVLGYAQYLWLLWFLYRVNNCTTMYYNRYIPAYTPFLVKIATLLEHAKWCFFLEGFLYVFEYFILIPKSKISASSINMPDNISFVITWIIILFVIILAFPTIIFIQEKLLEKIVDNLKTQSFESLTEKLKIMKYHESDAASLQIIYIYNLIIDKLLKSADYPIKSKRLGPAVISIATFSLHLITLLTQLPQLSYLSSLINRFLGNGV